MIHLRKAGKADLQSLFELDQLCFPAGIAYSLREFQSILKSARTVGVVAENSDGLAGFALAQTHGARLGHLITIDVAPRVRRQGIGDRLMGHIEMSIKERGAQSLRLETAVTNLGALHFYERRGYEMKGTIRNCYPGNLDAFVMEKKL